VCKYNEMALHTLYITEDLVNTPTELKVDNEQTQRQVSNSSR
jgi:hypothetical protein